MDTFFFMWAQPKRRLIERLVRKRNGMDRLIFGACPVPNAYFTIQEVPPRQDVD
jgi:hypothetical protein